MALWTLVAPAWASADQTIYALGDGADLRPTESHPDTLPLADYIKAQNPDRFFYLGDVYEKGTAAEFQDHYEVLYGALASRTDPVIGNHEYANRATGYLPYWNAKRGWTAEEALHRSYVTPEGWQVIAYDSENTDRVAEAAWVRAEVAKHSGTCRIVMSHKGRHVVADSAHADNADQEAVWQEIKQKTALQLTGHNHIYGRLEPHEGVNVITSGAGGRHLRSLGTDTPDHSARAASQTGIPLATKLVLRAGAADFKAVDKTGAVYDSGTITCTPAGDPPPPDTTPPAAPAGLTATATSATSVALAWLASTDDVGVAGYGVYRDGAALGTTAATTFTDTTALPSTTHSYTVDAVDAAGNRSAPSAPASATTPPGMPLPQCSDGIDNDSDGKVDAADPGCSSATDDSESPDPPQCADQTDNDSDGKVDLADPGCANAEDDSESPDPAPKAQCEDGIDNDSDGKVDAADPGCSSTSDDSESPDPVGAATAVSTSGSTVLATAATGAANSITVSKPSSTTFGVKDTAGVQAGAGCQQVSATEATCSNASTTLTSSKVVAGDMDDTVTVTTTAKATLDGGAGNDTLDGSVAANTLTGGAGNDTLSGGAGNDSFLEGSTASGADSIDGGTGTDTANYSSRPASVSVDLDGLADDGASGEGDDVKGTVEKVTGGKAGDTLTGSVAANTLTGGAGNDTLTGLTGADKFSGGSGDDTIEARHSDQDASFACGDSSTDQDVVTADTVDPVSASATNCEVVNKA